MGWLTKLFNRPKVENQPTEPVPAATRAETNPVGEELQPAQPAQTWKSYKVAGTSFRAESIREMAEENPVRSEWDDHRETEAYYMEQNEIPLFARLDILEITPTKKA